MNESFFYFKKELKYKKLSFFNSIKFCLKIKLLIKKYREKEKKIKINMKKDLELL